MNLSNLKPFPKSKKRPKRVGRGDSSGHGTYSGRGQKGQRARSGGRKGLKLKGIKSMIKRIPKLGGFRSIYPRMAIVNLENIEKKFSDNDLVTPEKLLEKGLIKSIKNGVKILGQGKLTKKLTVKANAFSKSAEEAIKKAGGKVIKI
ncbi:MAG: 50S ribosomal protein L15 [Patescibacteria group bacterium]